MVQINTYHKNSKPTYTTMIIDAINSSEIKMMKLSEIYDYILTNHKKWIPVSRDGWKVYYI